MYVARWDWKLGVAIWWFEGTVTNAEWEETFGHRRDLCDHSAAMPFRPAVLLYNQSDRPNAVRRKQLAEIAENPRYNPYIAFVSKSQQVRGAQLAMRWAGKTRPSYDKELFNTVAPALDWLEQQRGVALPELRAMTANVQKVAEQMRSRAARV